MYDLLKFLSESSSLNTKWKTEIFPDFLNQKSVFFFLVCHSHPLDGSLGGILLATKLQHHWLSLFTKFRLNNLYQAGLWCEKTHRQVARFVGSCFLELSWVEILGEGGEREVHMSAWGNHPGPAESYFDDQVQLFKKRKRSDPNVSIIARYNTLKIG